jgi:cell division protein FtsN
MSFELTFDSKSSIALVVCVLLLCALLAVAGFLLGTRHVPLAAFPAHLAVPAPALPRAPKKPALPSSSSSSSSRQGSSVSGAAEPPHAQSVPAAAPAILALATYELQFGAFTEQGHAAALAKELKQKSIASNISVQRSRTGASYYVVRSNAYPSLQSAADAARIIRTKTGETVVLRRRGSF